MTDAALDDVFADDITIPATDGYKLGATLFLPRGAKRHAVLISSATAVPRKIYRGFAGYLARRGCAVLTYDYRGIGGSRQLALEGYNKPKSLRGFKASMADWAALDATAAVGWMRERYAQPAARLCRPFLRRPGAGAAGQQPRGLARAADRGAGRLLEADDLAGALSRLCHDEFRRHPPHPRARLYAGLDRHRRGSAEGRVPAMDRLGEQSALSLRRHIGRGPRRTSLNTRARCARCCISDDPWATRPAVELLCAGYSSTRPEIITVTPGDVGVSKIGHFGFFRPEHRDTLWRGAAEWLETE